MQPRVVFLAHQPAQDQRRRFMVVLCLLVACSVCGVANHAISFMTESNNPNDRVGVLVNRRRFSLMDGYDPIEDVRTSNDNDITSASMDDIERHISVPQNQKLCKPLRDVQWEWNFFSQLEGSNRKHRSRRRLLIALYSGCGSSKRHLEQTAPINKEYARRWKYDVVILKGTGLVFESDQDCEPFKSRTPFNKIPLLEEALRRVDDYDAVLIMNPEMILHNKKSDIAQLLGKKDDRTMLVTGSENRTLSNIRNAVTLWNLKHPLTKQVALEWRAAAKKGIRDEMHDTNDQYHLKQTLRHMDPTAIKMESGLFGLQNGKVARKHSGLETSRRTQRDISDRNKIIRKDAR